MKNDEFRSIIDFAIENEVDAYEFYRDAAVKVKDKHLKEVFEDLSKEELEHKRFLKEFLSSDLDKIKIDESKDYKIAETIDKPKLSVEMDFAEAIGLAIKNEEEAMNIYSDLSKTILDQNQKDLFLGLMKMEQMHKTKLEKIYLEVAYAEVW